MRKYLGFGIIAVFAALLAVTVANAQSQGVVTVRSSTNGLSDQVIYTAPDAWGGWQENRSLSRDMAPVSTPTATVPATPVPTLGPETTPVVPPAVTGTPRGPIWGAPIATPAPCTPGSRACPSTPFPPPAGTPIVCPATFSGSPCD